jgi:hypothetical protein
VRTKLRFKVPDARPDITERASDGRATGIEIPSLVECRANFTKKLDARDFTWDPLSEFDFG